MNSKVSDVLVVGGGPAGLAAAIAIRQCGLRVTVVDGMHPPIDKACGEGLMPDSRAELAKLGIELSRADGAEFNGIHFSNCKADPAAESDSVTARFNNGTGLGVRRLLLHQKLADRAADAGVQLRWDSPVQFCAGGELRIHGEKLIYGYLVGADGQSSRVRTMAGLDGGKLISRRFGFRAHYRIRPWTSKGSRDGSRHVEVHWGERGQAYVTPVSENEICVAVMSRRSGMRLDQILSGLPFSSGEAA